jgi:hypothetical protein
MAASIYLVVHLPLDPNDPTVHPPSRLLELAREHGPDGRLPRWLKAWSPDLHDDRIFTLWEAENAAQIGRTLEEFGFLNHMTAQALRVREWGPAEVIAAEGRL